MSISDLIFNKLIRSKKPRRPFSEFLDFKETLKAAARKKLSVGDYIDHGMEGPSRIVNGKTTTQITIDGMKEQGSIFNRPIRSIVEIGPGSGRYAVKVHAQAPEAKYEIYETSKEWRDWLTQEYHWITPRKCDGRYLKETPSSSVDLVHAHRLFSGLPCLTVFRYWYEMMRVVRPGGFIVFDILPESTFTRESIQTFFREEACNWNWEPHIMPKEFVIDFFNDYDFLLHGWFVVPQQPSTSIVMIFRR